MSRWARAPTPALPRSWPRNSTPIGARSGRERAGRCETLRQSRLRHDARHGRQLGDGQFLDAASRGRGQGACGAAGRGGQGMEGARRRTDGGARSCLSRRRQTTGALRGSGKDRGRPAGPGKCAAQGPEGLQADRPRGSARRCGGQVRRHRAIHHRRRVARHARGAVEAAAAVRRDRQILRWRRRRCRARGRQSGAGAARCGRGGEGLLGGQAGAGCAQDRVG